jgi:hypothetical protein
MKEENKTINMTQLMKKNTEGEKMINQLEWSNVNRKNDITQYIE